MNDFAEYSPFALGKTIKLQICRELMKCMFGSITCQAFLHKHLKWKWKIEDFKYVKTSKDIIERLLKDEFCIL